MRRHRDEEGSVSWDQSGMAEEILSASILLTAVITQCCMEALYALGRDFQPVVDIAKRCERRKCNHREKKEPHDCIRDVVGEFMGLGEGVWRVKESGECLSMKSERAWKVKVTLEKAEGRTRGIRSSSPKRRKAAEL